MIDQEPIRSALRRLNPSVAHRAADKPNVSEIYSPPRHADALDPNRALVVGGRGVGKSFWAAVLADAESRAAAARAYPSLNLAALDVVLGFHEGALGTASAAPSPAALKSALRATTDATAIWRSVLIKAIAPDVGPEKLTERAQWIIDDPEEYENHLIAADKERTSRRRTILVVFDALDVLATDWETVRELTRGLARLALEIGSRRSIRMKLFMRRDQYEDMARSTFTDFSKLMTARVLLEWAPIDLYGALFTRLARDSESSATLSQLARDAGILLDGDDLPLALRIDEEQQSRLFATFASEYMGSDKKRGRTYSWVPKHLADAFGETSLRSFLIALREAADRASMDQRIAIDYQGINAGVLRASDTRREELKEDHPWVDDALGALSGLTVPCAEAELIALWQAAGTVDSIKERSDSERPAAPIQLELYQGDGEQALLQALIDLGVIELRNNLRVNVPDIFRVAANIKRKGGVAPRPRR